MQKKIIALAVAAATSGVAFAQSNVTISGEIKTHFNQVSANGAATTLATGAAAAAGTVLNASSRGRLDNGTSKLTFSGKEDLGNGMAAIFQIDSDVGSDTVAAGTTSGSGSIFGNRETYVGLTGKWGTFKMGRLNLHYHQHTGVDANGLGNGFGLQTSSLNLFGSTAGLTNGAASMGNTARGGRLNNVLQYQSPNLSGFTGEFSLSSLGDATTANLASKDRAWNLAVKFANGPIAAFYSLYNVKSNGPAAATAPGAQSICLNQMTGALTQAAACGAGLTAISTVAGGYVTGNGVDATSSKFGAAYTFPMGLKVGLIFDRSETEVSGMANSDSKRTAWSLPMSYTMGAHAFAFTYGRAANLTGNVWANNSAGASVVASQTAAKTDYRMHMLGYAYNLSKRTQFNAAYTVVQNGIASNSDFWNANAHVNGGQTVGADPTSFAVGLRHSF